MQLITGNNIVLDKSKLEKLIPEKQDKDLQAYYNAIALYQKTEAKLLARALAANSYSKDLAAQALGLSRISMFRKCKLYKELGLL